MPDIDFRFVGLVRNPMDVLYSAWRRWRLPPEAFQQHWRQAYENLEKLQQFLGDLVVTVRYEDFSPVNRTGTRLLAALRLPSSREGADEFIHGTFRNLWRPDRRFGFQLDPAVADVAMRYGYTAKDVANRRRLLWPLRRILSQMTHQCISRPVAFAKRELRQSVHKVRH
jgi:hypothetical protein